MNERQEFPIPANDDSPERTTWLNEQMITIEKGVHDAYQKGLNSGDGGPDEHFGQKYAREYLQKARERAVHLLSAYDATMRQGLGTHPEEQERLRLLIKRIDRRREAEKGALRGLGLRMMDNGLEPLEGMLDELLDLVKKWEGKESTYENAQKTQKFISLYKRGIRAIQKRDELTAESIIAEIHAMNPAELDAKLKTGERFRNLTHGLKKMYEHR